MVRKRELENFLTKDKRKGLLAQIVCKAIEMSLMIQTSDFNIDLSINISSHIVNNQLSTY
jgi:hypothetical protein